MQFPDILNTDFKANDFREAKRAIDVAVSEHVAKNKRRKKFQKLYNAYNGLIKTKDFDYLTKTYGADSKTKMIDYKIGRSKIQLLIGEFLNIGFDATVSTTNRDAVVEKMDKIKETMGFMKAKPYLEDVRKTHNLNIFPGVQIPDKDDRDALKGLNLKSKNEMIMQHIIDGKIKHQRIKDKLAENFINTAITSETFGVVEKDINGEDVYRPIDPEFAIYRESVKDKFLERTPYIGEVKKMYRHEILTTFRNLKSDDRNKIAKMSENPSDYLNSGSYDIIDGNTAIPVYIIEWKIVEPVRTKENPAKESDVPYMADLSSDYYNKNQKQIDREVKRGKYKVFTKYKESLWGIVRIGNDVYIDGGELDNVIQTRLGGEKFNVQYNYSGLLHGTINSTRVSLQEMIMDLSVTYNILRFQINREIGKIKGKVFTYNREFLPKGETTESVMYKLVEDGILDYDGSQDGNIEDGRDSSNAIKEMDLGVSQALPILVQLAIDVERTIDRITGINESRQGLTKATSTATASLQNIEASRSITYPLFYDINEYAKRVLIKLAEKTKINWEWLDSIKGGMLVGNDEVFFLKATKDLTNDDYGIYISDGRKEYDIKERLRNLYGVQINAGELRTHDVAEAEMQDTFVGYRKVLDDAWVEIQKNQAQQAQIREEAENKRTKMGLEIAREDREDRQQATLDEISLEGEVDKEKIILKGEVDKGGAVSKAKTDTVLKQQEHDNNLEVLDGQAKINEANK